MRVNKRIASGMPVVYAALLSGTISHVWYDEESASAKSPKRRNRIKVTREKPSRPTLDDGYEA